MIKNNDIILTETDNNVFFCSDLHYSHKNICYGTSLWNNKESNCRKFETLEKMNYAIVNAINSSVGQNDILYFLGDFSFGGIENIWNLRKQIVTKNIHCIYGNHDHHIKKNNILPNCHWDLRNDIIVDGAPEEMYEKDSVDNEYLKVYAQDLFLSINEFKTIIIEKQEIVLCHYPLDQWKDMDKGTWHLFGHTHGKLIDLENKRIDVGLDANNFKVLSFNDIKKIMKNRVNKSHV